MQSDDVLNLFRRSGALLEGHFVLSSGLHSSSYLQCALVFQHPPHAEELGIALASSVQLFEPGVVISPALGGLIVGHEVARALGVRALFAERKEGRLRLRRGFGITRGERVLVVEDVLTTGESTRETITVAQEAGGQVVGAVAVINRAGRSPDVGVPFQALADVMVPVHQPEICPLCTRNVPVTKPGSRANSGL